VILRLSLVVFALFVAPSASGSQPLKPPVIHEPFTPLACPKSPNTTRELEGCAEARVIATDRTIDNRAKQVFASLRTPAARQAFVTSEGLWLRYRRSSCKAEASFYDGGSIQPSQYLQCEVGRNLDHVADLAAMLRVLRQHH
jgi:uncharacterized protein YecT (DUF1311 family)